MPVHLEFRLAHLRAGLFHKVKGTCHKIPGTFPLQRKSGHFSYLSESLPLFPQAPLLLRLVSHFCHNVKLFRLFKLPLGFLVPLSPRSHIRGSLHLHLLHINYSIQLFTVCQTYLPVMCCSITEFLCPTILNPTLLQFIHNILLFT